MTDPDQYPREFRRRQHRVLAQFMMVKCWEREVDSFHLSVSLLKETLGLERLREVRLQQFIEDVKPWFDVHLLMDNKTKEITDVSFHRPLRDKDSWPSSHTMSVAIAGVGKSENERIQYLTSLAIGLDIPNTEFRKAYRRKESSST